MAHTFEDLVQLEQAAEQARTAHLAPDAAPAARQAWIDAAARFQAAVTKYAAAAEGESRYNVEMRVKRAVRHPGTGV